MYGIFEMDGIRIVMEWCRDGSKLVAQWTEYTLRPLWSYSGTIHAP